MYAITSAGSPKPPQMQKGTWSDYHHPANYVLISLLGGVLYYSHPSFFDRHVFSNHIKIMYHLRL